MSISKAKCFVYVFLCSSVLFLSLAMSAQSITFQSKQQCERFVNDVIELYNFKYNPNVLFQDEFEGAERGGSGAFYSDDFAGADKCDDTKKGKIVSVGGPGQNPPGPGTSKAHAKELCNTYHNPCKCIYVSTDETDTRPKKVIRWNFR